MYQVKDMKVTLLGVIPQLQDKTGFLKPQDIVALSALMTFKGKSVQELYNEIQEKGQDLEKRIKTIIRKSSLRGHASIATTPALCFTYEASKFIDSLMTGMVFSSSLMASGRRTQTTADDIVYPQAIFQNKGARQIYEEVSRANIDLYNEMLASGINKDEASKILHYGIYGTGIIMYPLESLVAFKKEVEAEAAWMPEEARLLIQNIEKQLKSLGVELIYASRELAARNVLPYPNIFKNPQKSNLTRELIEQHPLPSTLTKVLAVFVTAAPGLEKEAKKILQMEKKIQASKQLLKKHWRTLLQQRHYFCRDYNTALQVKVLSSVSWRVWGDKKRHRTVPLTPDSVYYSLLRCRPLFEKLSSKIARASLTKSELAQIDRYFSLPPCLLSEKNLLFRYLNQAKEAILAYFTLTEKYLIPPAEAIYLIPRGIRVDLVQTYDLFNLISGYYPLRSCTTAEAQLRPLTLREMSQIRNELTKKGYPHLAQLIVPKCHIPLFCLEEKNCPVIQGKVKNYHSDFHQEMKDSLDSEFEQKLQDLSTK
jgi:hypothetical protein